MATLPSAGAYDVVVVGSGSAGSPAAIGAARGGSRTLLIEKLPFLGGNSTAVLDTFYGFVTPGERLRKVVAGIADEVVDELRRLSEVVSRQNTYGAGIRCHLRRRASESGVGAPRHGRRRPGDAALVPAGRGGVKRASR